MSIINLASLDGNNGFRLDGVSTGDNLGISVSSAGDVNGDGFDDVIVKAPNTGPDANGYSGSSYVVFGKVGGFDVSLDLSSLDGSNGFRLDERSLSGNSGISVSSAGDVNGDGFDDVMIGTNSYFSELAGYVMFGKADGFNAALVLDDLDGSDGFTITDAPSGNIGAADFSVSSAGDVNGDGFDDMIVGGQSQIGSFSAVVFGRASGFSAATSLSTLDGTNGFRLSGAGYGGGGYSYDGTGRSVSDAGDVNGDGFSDVIVGAPSADPNGDSSGSSYVVFGRASGFDARLDPEGLDGSNGFRLDGVAADDRSGDSVSSAGDVNGDGFDDVIIGAFGADPTGSFSGSSYVVFGKATSFDGAMNLSALDGNNGFRIDGATAGDGSGRSVSSAGDVNGDGFSDVIVGAPSADPNGDSSGSSYVVFGKATGFDAAINLSALDSNNGFRIDGATAGDGSGGTVSNAGDVNNDGFDDLIVGAALADANGTNSGVSYVIFGRSDFSGGLPEILGTSGDDVLRGTSVAELFEAGDGNDVMIGRGGADVFRGGAGVDQIKMPDLNFESIDGGSGHDILHFAGANLNLDLATYGDKIQGIETICLNGRGDNTLTLTVDSVLNLSDTSNTLKLHGNAGDRVTVQDDGWVDAGPRGGGFYHAYTNDDAVLLVGANLAIEFV